VYNVCRERSRYYNTRSEKNNLHSSKMNIGRLRHIVSLVTFAVRNHFAFGINLSTNFISLIQTSHHIRPALNIQFISFILSILAIHHFLGILSVHAQKLPVLYKSFPSITASRPTHIYRLGYLHGHCHWLMTSRAHWIFWFYFCITSYTLRLYMRYTILNSLPVGRWSHVKCTFVLLLHLKRAGVSGSSVAVVHGRVRLWLRRQQCWLPCSRHWADRRHVCWISHSSTLVKFTVRHRYVRVVIVNFTSLKWQ